MTAREGPIDSMEDIRASAIKEQEALTSTPIKEPIDFTQPKAKTKKHGLSSAWKSMGLRSRILLMLSLLVLITVGGGIASIWHVLIMEGIFYKVTDTEIPALQAAQALKTALVMQKGYVTYYFQDEDPTWLKELNKHHESFEEWLKQARRWAGTERAREILNEIDSRYIRYRQQRDEVVDLYKKGKKGEGFSLQQRVRGEFFDIIRLCLDYQVIHEKRVADAVSANRNRAEIVYRMALAALLCVVLLGLFLGYTLIKQVLGPIRQLAAGTDKSIAGERMQDEVKALGNRFDSLLRDIDQTRDKLEWSREHLQMAEKWAMVGKLAAGVAHSVRNPLTSVKMRLFSLERGLDLTRLQKEDFEVISEEIRNIDKIVSNFLAYSRRPKLSMRAVSPSDVVDTAVQLLKHRLESYSVKVDVKRNGRLPLISADPDQLKEVLVNLIVNACEVMPEGGTIWIEERTTESDNGGRVVIVSVQDDGPGVSESVRTKMFQPFFSTKEEGTGLGLSIAMKIVEEHGGWLDLQSDEGEGACFVITLPEREDESWEKSS
ncbi:MAG: ATP-binding protein [Desulfomonilaceae bacterium]|nr:ATP-binding protein [Desulfomonilaceae bacterium]